jgi:P-aminobenzoate N-oxygenase AurF
MHHQTLETAVERLCAVSQAKYVNPYTAIDWPEQLDRNQWCMSPELISIFGTEAYGRLSAAEQRRLSFYEAVNFFSLNIHGERPLVEGLARRLYRKGHQAISSYLHHFLDEENKHMTYFGGFCLRYAGKIYADKKLAFPRTYAPGEEDFLFFTKTLIFEKIVDVYNIRMSKDMRLAPLVRRINLLHHLDEARHLAFGHLFVQQMFQEYRHQWSDATLQALRDYLSNYLVATWNEYFNPEVYRDAGLDDPYGLKERAFHQPWARAHRREVTENCIRYLLSTGILSEEPVL